jgi:Protein of unknown function (DUF2905)
LGTYRELGLILVGLGALLAVAGLVVYWGGFSWFGRLPGDIRYESGSTRIFVPLTSMVLLSILLTVLLNVLRRFL